MTLTQDNYFTIESSQKYFSASQIKSFMDCPSRTMAEIRGEYVRQPSQALLVGSYVDAHFEGSLELFKAKNPSIFKRDGSLKSEYIQAERMIERAEQDELFMTYMQGRKQVVLTGEIAGYPFKSKLDVYLPGTRIVDLKTVRDFEMMYKPGQGRISFAEYWNYPLQLAIYQTLERNRLPVYLACISKQDPPDLALISIPQHALDTEMELLIDKLPYIDAIKQGIIEPPRCERCAHCRATRVLNAPITLEELHEAWEESL